MPFITPGESATPYHVLSIEGPAKSGKSDLAYKAPKKMAIQSTDRGWDGVIQKQEDYKPENFMISHSYYDVDLRADDAMKAQQKNEAYQLADAQAEKVNSQVWQPFRRDFDTALVHPEVRSIVWDLADEQYDFLRLANFGKLERNSQLGYVPVNAEYLGLIRKAHQFSKTLIMVNQVAQVYRTIMDGDKEKSIADPGKFKRKGPGSIEFLVHSFVKTHYVPPVRDPRTQNITTPQRFLVEILRARLNPAENGRILENPDWMTLMAFLAPDVPMEAWV